MRRLYLRHWAGFLALAAAAVVAAAASAADMPAPAPAYTPHAYMAPAAYNWSGLYFGASVGANLMNDSVTTTATTAPATLLQPFGTVTRLSPYGIVGGPQAGFNIEFAPVVVGVEGTWMATNISGTQVTPSQFLAGTSEQSTSAAYWYTTATGRIGIAVNDLLFYAKGGGAWMHVDYIQSITAGAVISQQTIADNRRGYTVGGGIEYGLTENISAKIEYDYLGFGTKNYSFNNLSVPAGGGTGPLGPFSVAIKSYTQLLVAGMNYRFTWGGGGYAAKY
jgi:outer membrane immunogenic protein